MKAIAKWWIGCSACAFTIGWTFAAEPAVLSNPMVAFLDLNCYDCHNDVDTEGELDLESLLFDPTDRDDLKRWSLIYDRVKDQEMPPRDEVQPETDERADFVQEFEELLHDVSQQHQQARGRVRSRRLNRVEFENTIHDLLGVDLPIVSLLPEDSIQDGFSNVANAQQLSYHLLEKYMEIVDVSLADAFDRATKPFPTYEEFFIGEELSDNFNIDAKRSRQPLLKDGYAVAIACSNNYHGRMTATTVPASGWYRFTIRAKAFNPQEGRGVWTKIRSGVCSAKAPRMFWVGQFLAEEEVKEFVFETWMIEGHRLELRPGDNTLKFTSTDSVNKGTAVENGATGTAIESILVERMHRGPDRERLRDQLFSGLDVRDGEFVSRDSSADLKRLMVTFAERAFRRPVAASVLKPYQDYAAETLAETGSLRKALIGGYRSLLSSPRFLFFTEKLGPLDDYSLASRLSYFLWSSQPDAELMRLAKQGALSRPAVLSTQVERLLDDPKAISFIKNFSDDWLNLKDIDFTNPDEQLYPEFDDNLKHSMLAETHAFLREMMDANLSVTNVIDSDFAMLNERLALHYGVEQELGAELEKVSLTGTERRGGIITQGSVLKVTANGTTTSPIVRGVWVLENILGEHVLPPPDNVPAIEPDIRGAISIRDQLDKHRSIEACMVCHRKIDPPGFALENYDVVGGWRENYRAIEGEDSERWTDGPVVDASSEMLDGRSFEDISGFKEIALAHPDLIARNLARKLLIYATGASIEFADRREIDRIVADAAKDDYGFRSLIKETVSSSIFRSK